MRPCFTLREEDVGREGKGGLITFISQNISFAFDTFSAEGSHSLTLYSTLGVLLILMVMVIWHTKVSAM